MLNSLFFFKTKIVVNSRTVKINIPVIEKFLFMQQSQIYW